MPQLLLATLAACLSTSILADDVKKDAPPKIEVFTSAEKAGADFNVQGEYVCDGPYEKLGAQIIAKGDGKFDVRILAGGLPGDGWRGIELFQAQLETNGTRVTFEKRNFNGFVVKNEFRIHGNLASLYDTTKIPGQRPPQPPAQIRDIVNDSTAARPTVFEPVARKSPTLGRPAPPGARIIFDGTSADAWDKGKLVETNLLHWGTTSKDKFNDCTIHLEFRLPFMPRARGQARANSGVYVQGRYEVQVLDSFGLEGKDNECGGIYTKSAPKVNMCFPPLSWQTYDIDFVAAKFDGAGKKTSDAVMTVRHNAVLVQDHVKVNGPTGGSLSPESAEPGPIHLQDHGDPVVFRNIWVLPKK